ncbi:16S rRNA (cytosine(1402)-N(4))-methyltransferase RsmH [Helicobacter pylori]|uniref:16S rRNA (cytosine(1402)-N(4))-methyltransferase RsmH n=1 Tax=Helicobacter pylori TaxID=210 RepID=UPI000BEA147D|nr:16S rRNA (cytosine(1402)-N(4))-methyltransferase RsmH [Helicobacter pylori]PDW23657.1 16S rRNA (cytosine(1402)-N(4))-methyltransferase [Helicobacter pylori]PDX35891.1 16S rRNA (cytosine(1402)-N(4))-methyltransferase [Helicobacter pylori]
MQEIESLHQSVLLQEVLQAFTPLEEGVLIDCTLGLGGHSKALLSQKPHLKLIGIDKDKFAQEIAKERLKEFEGRYNLLSGGFAKRFKEALEMYGDRIKGVLVDLGVSSLQLDDDNRGFNFHSHALDMRMDLESDLNAQKVINSYPVIALEKIFRDYGEIKEYKKIAHKIAERRAKKPFKDAKDLSEFLSSFSKNKKIHPATLVFQAVRIEVNSELEELKEFLQCARNLKGAILCVISFHSLEDALVKNAFKDYAKNCICDPSSFKCTCSNNHALGAILTKKPITPSPEEIKNNRRSRSAKMRVFQFKP